MAYILGVHQVCIQLLAPKSLSKIKWSYVFPQIAVLVTSGPQAKPDTPLADLAGELKDIGVDIYSVGIGPNVIPSELEAMASRPEYIFRAQTTSLPILASQLNGLIRQGKLMNAACIKFH